MAPIEFSVVRSSSGRSWNGFDATVYDTTPGIDETVFSQHCISMHLGSPVLAVTRCDGLAVERLAHPGDIKIIPAGFARTWEAAASTRKISVKIGASLLRTAADAMNVRYERLAIEPRLDLRDLRIEYVVRALSMELESAAPLGRLYADSLGMALAAHLLRYYASTPEERAPRGLSPASLHRVLDYIAEYVARDLALAELADVAGVSPSHFNVLFKRSVGVSAHRYVVRSRVELAARLLAAGELSVSEVALEAGFANPSHLAMWMGRIVGTTPSAFRRHATASEPIRNRANVSDGNRSRLLRLTTL